MSTLIIFTAGVRASEQGEYAEFMTSPDEKSIDDYINIMQDTVNKEWEIVKHVKNYQCVLTTLQIITRKQRRAMEEVIFTNGDKTSDIDDCSNNGCGLNKDGVCQASGTECFGYFNGGDDEKIKFIKGS